jgi:hypothetical protein
MIPVTTSITHGLLICIPFTVFVAISFLANPRLWLHSLPADIQRRAAPKSARERRFTRYLLLPVYVAILPGLSTVSSVLAAQSTPVSFVTLLGHMYVIWIVVHLWDLIIIDGISMLLIDPMHPPVDGTEGLAGWTNCWFHVKSFSIAVVMSALFVVPASAILYYLMR